MSAVLDAPGAVASAAWMQVPESAAVVAPVAVVCLMAAGNVPASTCLPDCQAARNPTPTVLRQSAADLEESEEQAASLVVLFVPVGLP